ncbi:MAG: helix-turn-helix domain-containing protein [bacterium]
MEKISIARRRLEKQNLPLPLCQNYGDHNNSHEERNDRSDSTTAPEPPVNLNSIDVSSLSIDSLVMEEAKSPPSDKRQFIVEIVSGLERPTRMVISVQPVESEETEGNFLTIDEAAKALRVSRNTIYRQLRSGHLQGQKIGHQWRVLLKSINIEEG